MQKLQISLVEFPHLQGYSFRYGKAQRGDSGDVSVALVVILVFLSVGYSGSVLKSDFEYLPGRPFSFSA